MIDGTRGSSLQVKEGNMGSMCERHTEQFVSVRSIGAICKRDGSTGNREDPLLWFIVQGSEAVDPPPPLLFDVCIPLILLVLLCGRAVARLSLTWGKGSVCFPFWNFEKGKVA